MIRSLVIIDDFYKDPDRIRKLALSCTFDVFGNYPGVRTKAFRDGGTKEAFSSLLGSEVASPLWYSSKYNGAFQSVTATASTWVHVDSFNQYAAMVFLSPNPPIGTGIAFYRHKETGVECWPNSVETEANSIDGTIADWECISKVANKYNRCVIFNSQQYHAADGYMGDSLETSRLFHTFFFNVK